MNMMITKWRILPVKNILSIYTKDIQGIVTNWAAAILIIGLIILPSLYAWFNIKASWDPYGQTSGIKVAVANQDTGAAVKGTGIKIGDEIISSLKENHKIGWIFTTESKALQGVKHGDYYAAIIIPSNFSERIATVLTHNPEKAEILYYVNEKINAIAPKITSTGASSIIHEVNQNFIKTANGAIFRIFNTLGVELKEELPLLLKMKSLILRLEDLFPEINQAADTAVNDLHTSRTIVKKVQDELPHAAELAEKGRQFAHDTSQFLDQSGNALDSAAPAIKEMLQHLQMTAEAANQTSNLLLTAIDLSKHEDIHPRLSHLPKNTVEALAIASNTSASAANLFQRLGSDTNSSVLMSVSSDLDRISGHFKTMSGLLSDSLAAIETAKSSAEATLADLTKLSAEAAQTLERINGNFDPKIMPAIQTAISTVKKEAAHAGEILQSAISDLPAVDKVLLDAAQGLNVAVQEAEMVRTRLPEAESKLKNATKRIADFEKKASLQDLINLLTIDFAKESEFFAEPVKLVENVLYPIPNYGSAMSPFFTTLSLWVGGILLVSLLTVQVHGLHEGIKSYHEYFGRYLTFVTIALLQSLVVTAGDLLFLKAYAADPVKFVLFGLFNSAVFMLMIYTFVSVFGNVGKAMAVVLLVLQLAGSGGTFPIQVTPPFFQAIYPYLPFTYAISLMREAVGGSVRDIVLRDFIILLIYVGITLILGVGLKRFVNRLTAKSVEKAKSGHLIH